MYPVITISREFGSGGHTIGELVAKELGIPFYDGEIVTRVAQDSGYAEDIIKEQGEYSSPSGRWMDTSTASAMYFQTPQDEIFLAQRKVILDCASEGPCVIVGRCADYILDNAGVRCLNIFIHSDMAHRTKRIVERYGEIEHIDARRRLEKKDKQRKTYYRYYTDRVWGDYHNYDLSLNSGRLGEDACVSVICQMARNADE